MEMLIIVTIIAILMAIVFPRFVASSGQAKKSSHIAERQTINAQMELFYFNNGNYPIQPGGSLNTWISEVESYFPDGIPATCNQGVLWKIKAGRIDMSEHKDHE